MMICRYYKIVIILTLFIIKNVQSQVLENEFKPVLLEEFTSLSLDIFPDAGTQLAFPFLLDNPELRPSLKIKLTNANGFDVPTEPNEIKELIVGQNTITILGLVNEDAPSAKYISNLFITIGSYNISISLKTTFDTKKHTSNIVFKLSEKDKNHLLESMFDSRSKELESQYKEKYDSLEEMARMKSLSHIADMATFKAKKSNFKNKQEIEIEDSTLTVFVDKFVRYGDNYGVLLMTIKNSSSYDFNIKDIKLYSMENNKQNIINGAFKCDNKLRADKKIKCAYSTLKSKSGKKKNLKLEILTDRGTGEIIW